MLPETLRKSFYEKQDLARMSQVHDFENLRLIAEEIIFRIRQEYRTVGICCGPMMTGGLRDSVANFYIFDKVIIRLQESLPIFNQLPFESHFQRLFERFSTRQVAYNNLFLHFYYPLFYKIDTYYFLPNWKTSTGANLEYLDIKKHNEQGLVFLDESVQFVDFFESLKNEAREKFCFHS